MRPTSGDGWVRYWLESGIANIGDRPYFSLTPMSRLIASRQNVSPRRLVDPGPNAAQLRQLLEAAAAASDHGLLLPWRLVIVPRDKRALLAEVFALALTDRDSTATAE